MKESTWGTTVKSITAIWLHSLDLQSQKLIDDRFLTKVDFVAYENCAIVSIPINNVQSHVTIIR